MNEAEMLDALKAAMRDPEVRVRIVQTMSHGRAAQVYVKTRKVGPLLFPADGQGLSDVMSMLGGFADGDS